MFSFIKNFFKKVVNLADQLVTVIVEKIKSYKEQPEELEGDLTKVKSLVVRAKDFALVVIQILVLVSASKAEVHSSFNDWKNSTC